MKDENKEIKIKIKELLKSNKELSANKIVKKLGIRRQKALTLIREIKNLKQYPAKKPKNTNKTVKLGKKIEIKPFEKPLSYGELAKPKPIIEPSKTVVDKNIELNSHRENWISLSEQQKNSMANKVYPSVRSTEKRYIKKWKANNYLVYVLCFVRKNHNFYSENQEDYLLQARTKGIDTAHELTKYLKLLKQNKEYIQNYYTNGISYFDGFSHQEITQDTAYKILRSNYYE